MFPCKLVCQVDSVCEVYQSLISRHIQTQASLLRDNTQRIILLPLFQRSRLMSHLRALLHWRCPQRILPSFLPSTRTQLPTALFAGMTTLQLEIGPSPVQTNTSPFLVQTATAAFKRGIVQTVCISIRLLTMSLNAFKSYQQTPQYGLTISNGLRGGRTES